MRKVIFPIARIYSQKNATFLFEVQNRDQSGPGPLSSQWDTEKSPAYLWIIIIYLWIIIISLIIKPIIIIIITDLSPGEGLKESKLCSLTCNE